MLRGVEYQSDGRLQDDTGHIWQRVADWVEPDEAARLVKEGTPYLVQYCRDWPVREHQASFPRFKRSMLTWSQVLGYENKREVPTVLVGEIWRSEDAGDCLLLVEQGPHVRGDDQLE